jgi:hypothetical protein
MSLAELVITSVKVEGRSQSEVARDLRISRFWVHQLVKRFEVEGEAAFQPGSRRPHRCPHAVGTVLEDQIIRLRKDLSKRGLDAGGRRSGHAGRGWGGRGGAQCSPSRVHGTWACGRGQEGVDLTARVLLSRCLGTRWDMCH